MLVNSSSHCTLRVQWDIDPVVPVLPDVIVSFVTQTYAHLGAVQFRDMVKNLSAEHQERMRSDPHVYGFFEERMRQAGADRQGTRAYNAWILPQGVGCIVLWGRFADVVFHFDAQHAPF